VSQEERPSAPSNLNESINHDGDRASSTTSDLPQHFPEGTNQQQREDGGGPSRGSD
jgi:hypothetical protein